MNILCVNYEYPPVGGGGGTVCKDLSERMVRFGHRVDVVTSALKGLPRCETLGGVGIHRVPCVRRHRHYVTTPEMLTEVVPTCRKVRELVSQRRYHVNHTHFVVPSGIASYLLWKERGIPYVLTAHGSDVPGYNPDRFNLTHRLIGPLWRAIVSHAARVVAPSGFLRQLLLKQIDVEVDVIPNGIDFPSPDSQPKQNRILVVTRMFERKGVQYFLEAVRNLATDWEILIAGDGPYMPRLREIARGVAPKISFLGFIRGEALTRLYHSSKVFVFPSTQENFPVVLLEAMGAGCAVITTSASGCAEVVGPAAVQVPPKEVAGLRQAVERMVHDEGEIERLSRLGRQRAEMFRAETAARRYERLFEEIVGEERGP